MAAICILTDSTAQFPSPMFDGRKLVNVIPLHIQLNGEFFAEGEELRASDLPVTAGEGLEPRALSPSVEEFEETFLRLGINYTQVVALLHSSHLTDTYKHARQAAAAAQGHVSIEIIDSQTTAIGLGLLVQAAAEAAERGMDATEIERLVRSLIPHIYSVFCIEGLTYLQHSGKLGQAQAAIGEYLNVLPLYVLDGGQLTPTQKARNHRHLVDLLHEFLYEFPNLEHIAILQGSPPFEQETRALRERIAESFPDLSPSEHTISAALATLIGPRSLGLFVMQRV